MCNFLNRPGVCYTPILDMQCHRLRLFLHVFVSRDTTSSLLVQLQPLLCESVLTMSCYQQPFTFTSVLEVMYGGPFTRWTSVCTLTSACENRSFKWLAWGGHRTRRQKIINSMVVLLDSEVHSPPTLPWCLLLAQNNYIMCSTNYVMVPLLGATVRSQRSQTRCHFCSPKAWDIMCDDNFV